VRLSILFSVVFLRLAGKLGEQSFERLEKGKDYNSSLKP
jgi:hypothetical protein